MNHPERQEPSSDWDSLYSELGLEPPPAPAPALPAAPKREALNPAPVHDEEPAEPRGGRGPRRRREAEEPEERREREERQERREREEREDREEPQRHFEESHGLRLVEEEPDLADDEEDGGFLPAPEEFVAETDVEEVVGFVGPDETSEADEPGDEPAEGAPAGEAPPERTGRRRRRRRRRKGGGADSAATPGTEPASEAAEPETEFAAAERGEDDEPFHSEVLSDDESAEEKPAVPAALDEELEAEAEDEPLPEWNVVSWTELIATLHRPER